MASTWTVEDGKAVWDGRRLSEWTEVLVDELVNEFDPTAVWLYGSVARSDDNGDGDSDIDIDILVVLDSFDTSDAIDLKVRHSTRRRQALRSMCRSPTPTATEIGAESLAPSNGQPSSTGSVCTDVTEPPNPSAATARSWLAKAADDLTIAELVLNSDVGVEWAACFHAQQAAKKAVIAVASGCIGACDTIGPRSEPGSG